MLPWSVMPERRLTVGHRLGHQLVESGRAVEHRELGVDVEMGERVAQLHLLPSFARVDR